MSQKGIGGYRALIRLKLAILSFRVIFQRLSKDGFFARYSVRFQSAASNVIPVTKQDTRKCSTAPLSAIQGEIEFDDYFDPLTSFELLEDVELFLNPHSLPCVTSPSPAVEMRY